MLVIMGYQCAIPVFDGLLPEPHNNTILRLLFTCAHWHGLAKLRMHTSDTLNIFDDATRQIGAEFRVFKATTCPAFETRELDRERDARLRSCLKKGEADKPSAKAPSAHLPKTLNIQTAAECAKLGMEEFLGNYSPTSELPRSNSRHSSPRQHPISLVGNNNHRLRQLHLLDVGLLWRSQPQPRHQQRLKLLQHDHNVQSHHTRSRDPFHCTGNCRKLHTTYQNPRR